MNAARWHVVRETLDRAIALAPDRRPGFLDQACGHDSELRKEVESLLRCHEHAGEFLNNPVFDLQAPVAEAELGATWIGRRVGPYEILEEIGRGGMGEVYRARRADGQYTQDVAIKFVRSGMDRRIMAERFRSERQILAGLEHPHIARLLDGGTTEEGLPYLVMERVVGTPLDVYSDRFLPDLAARLQLFQKVCAAVAYAHQRLVIHRDIKPGNILVTEAGTPKLLDFGVAKIVDPAGTAEGTMLRPLTPAYASPEQIRSEPVSTATDIYALGGLLYRMLTGRAPFAELQRSPHALSRAICETEPPRPSDVVREGSAQDPEISAVSVARIRRQLRGDLDAIVLKALRKEPLQRYRTADQFSEDIQRYLQGHPVVATAGSRGYRARKFVKRHRVGFAATVAIVVAAIAGLVATLREARIAVANEVRAERRFNDVRQLADSFLFEFHDAIRDLPGSTPARRLIVSRALKYLDELSAESGADLSLRRDLATAYEKVGDVQGSPYQSNLGDYPGALISYRRALDLRLGLTDKLPLAKLDLGRSYGEIGEILFIGGDLRAAQSNYDHELLALTSLDPNDPDVARELTRLHVREGRVLLLRGDIAGAVKSFDSGVASAEWLLTLDSRDRTASRALGYGLIYLGDAYDTMGRLTEALTAYRRALAALESIVQPSNTQSARDVMVARSRAGDILWKQGDRDSAMRIARAALSFDENAARMDPSNALVRRDVYIDYFKLSRLQMQSGDRAGARFSKQRTIVLCEAEVRASPANKEIRGNLATAYYSYGDFLEASGELAEAAQNFQNALTVAQDLARDDPHNADIRYDVFDDLTRLANVHRKLKRFAVAHDEYAAVLQMRESLAASLMDDVEGRSLEADLYAAIGDLVRESHRGFQTPADMRWRAESLQWYRKSVGVWDSIANGKLLRPAYQKQRASVRRRIAELTRAG